MAVLLVLAVSVTAAVVRPFTSRGSFTRTLAALRPSSYLLAPARRAPIARVTEDVASAAFQSAMRSFLDRLPPRPGLASLPECGGNRTEVESDFRFDAALFEQTGQEARLLFAVTRLCVPAQGRPPSRVAFRVRTTGTAFTAVPPHLSVMHGHEHALTGAVRVLDAGAVELHCAVQSWNQSASTLTDDFPKQQTVPQSDERLWRHRPVRGSPLGFNVSLSSSASSSLPLCFSDWSMNFTLAGRWVAGAERGQRDWRKPDLFTLDPQAQWVPYDCRLDRTSSLDAAVRRLRWLHVVGDSNARKTFLTWCRVLRAAVYNGTRTPPVSQWDLPKLCTLDDGASVMTYSHWLTHKAFVLRPHMSFAEQCARYTETAELIAAQGTMYGWSHCALAGTAVQGMAGPGLTLFLWGSHGSELGANARTLRFFTDSLFAHAYFKRFPVLVWLVHDVDESQVPAQFGAQWVYRNSERIEAQSGLIAQAVRAHWHDYPTLYEDADGHEVRGFSPLFDVFSPSHAAKELLHPDAVHFPPAFEEHVGAWVAHWVAHAPQTDPHYRRVQRANITITTEEVGYIL